MYLKRHSGIQTNTLYIQFTDTLTHTHACKYTIENLTRTEEANLQLSVSFPLFFSVSPCLSVRSYLSVYLTVYLFIHLIYFIYDFNNEILNNLQPEDEPTSSTYRLNAVIQLTTQQNFSYRYVAYSCSFRLLVLSLYLLYSFFFNYYR